MNSTMTFEVITPARRQRFEELTALIGDLVDGSIGILPGHAPLLAETGGDVMLCRFQSGEEQRIHVGPGILVVEGHRVTLFTAGEDLNAAGMPVRLMANLLAQSKNMKAMDDEG